MDQEQIKQISTAVLGEIFGIYIFFNGFRTLHKKRLIQNVPTSTVRAIPMGEVEIKGKAKAKNLLKTPVSKIPCVFFRYVEEEWRKVGKSYRWVKTLDTTSRNIFYLVDDTGAVKILPDGAELNLVNNYVSREGNIRKTEYYILENEYLYVLGRAKKLPSIHEIENQIVEKKIEQIIKNPDEKIKLDKNRDMWIDENELTEVKEKIKEEARIHLEKATELQKDDFVPSHLSDVIICKTDGFHFIISTMEENKMVESFKKRSAFMIFGGSFLIVFFFWLILKTITAK